MRAPARVALTVDDRPLGDATVSGSFEPYRFEVPLDLTAEIATSESPGSPGSDQRSRPRLRSWFVVTSTNLASWFDRMTRSVALLTPALREDPDTAIHTAVPRPSS